MSRMFLFQGVVSLWGCEVGGFSGEVWGVFIAGCQESEVFVGSCSPFAKKRLLACSLSGGAVPKKWGAEGAHVLLWGCQRSGVGCPVLFLAFGYPVSGFFTLSRHRTSVFRLQYFFVSAFGFQVLDFRGFVLNTFFQLRSSDFRPRTSDFRQKNTPKLIKPSG